MLSQALSNERLSNFEIIILLTTGLFPVNFNPWIDQQILGHSRGDLLLVRCLCHSLLKTLSEWDRLVKNLFDWQEGTTKKQTSIFKTFKHLTWFALLLPLTVNTSCFCIYLCALCSEATKYSNPMGIPLHVNVKFGQTSQ